MNSSLVSVCRYLLVTCALLTLSACGVSSVIGPATVPTPSEARTASSTPNSTATTVKLDCTSHELPITTDSVSVTLSCAVTGAASEETSFTVSYTSTGPKEQMRTTLAVCRGAVHNGSGTCAITFGALSQDVTSIELVGELLPTGRSLGPQTPVPVP